MEEYLSILKKIKPVFRGPARGNQRNVKLPVSPDQAF